MGLWVRSVAGFPVVKAAAGMAGVVAASYDEALDAWFLVDDAEVSSEAAMQ